MTDTVAGVADACVGCGRVLAGRTAFRFPGATGDITKCPSCSLRHRPMLGRSLRVALVVGTVLTLINQGDTVLHGHWTLSLLWKVPLTITSIFGKVYDASAVTPVRQPLF